MIINEPAKEKARNHTDTYNRDEYADWGPSLVIRERRHRLERKSTTLLLLPLQPQLFSDEKPAMRICSSGASRSCSMFGVVSILRTDVKARFLSRRDNRTEPGALPQVPIRKRPAPKVAVEASSQICADVPQTKRRSEHLAPLQHRQPAARVQFGPGALLQQFAKPTPLFENEDDDENEDETRVPGPVLGR